MKNSVLEAPVSAEPEVFEFMVELYKPHTDEYRYECIMTQSDKFSYVVNLIRQAFPGWYYTGEGWPPEFEFEW